MKNMNITIESVDCEYPRLVDTSMYTDYYDSKFYQITKKTDKYTHKFKLHFFPRVRLNRYLPTILMDSFIHTGSSLKCEIDTAMRGTKTLTEVEQVIQAYQIAIATVKAAQEFWEKGEQNAEETNARECKG